MPRILHRASCLCRKVWAEYGLLRLPALSVLIPPAERWDTGARRAGNRLPLYPSKRSHRHAFDPTRRARRG